MRCYADGIYPIISYTASIFGEDGIHSLPINIQSQVSLKLSVWQRFKIAGETT